MGTRPRRQHPGRQKIVEGAQRQMFAIQDEVREARKIFEEQSVQFPTRYYTDPSLLNPNQEFRRLGLGKER